MTRLAWDPVTTDCHGSPETAAGYEVPAMLVVLLMWILGAEANLNPVYEWRDATQHVEAPPATLPDPAPGDVLMWRDPIVAIDLAGNRSDEVCE